MEEAVTEPLLSSSFSKGAWWPASPSFKGVQLNSVPLCRVGSHGRKGQSLCCPLQPLCPKELWHFVHQCYGNELGLTSDDEDYVPPDDDFNTMG